MQTFEKIVSFFLTGNKWLGIVAVVWLFILNIQRIDSFYDLIKNKRKKLIREDINDNNLEEDTKETLKEELNSLMFKEIFGIRANKNLRRSINSLVAQVDINILDVKKSIRYIEIKNNLLSINLTLGDEVKYYINVAFCFLCALASILLLLLFMLISTGVATVNQEVFLTAERLQIIFLLCFVVYMFLTRIFYKDVIAYKAAEKLKKFLEAKN
ncbi:hypothetical protein [Neisseria dentiae]|uniref:hypothetical protein n=1 Tax=Neisseria dentiae TaxID=194197 RepID=UPI00359F924D